MTFNMASKMPLVSYDGIRIPAMLERNFRQLKEFEVREADIFVVGFPKCGTTWLEQIVYLIVHGVDYDDPYGYNIEERIPYIEYPHPGLENIRAREGQRILKTHVPYSMLPPPIHEAKGKVVCIARNPKDVVVSFYHFYRMNNDFGYEEDFDAFYKHFIDDNVFYAPYLRHLEEIWHHRNDSNVLFLQYEDMKMDLPGCVETVAKFLECPLSGQHLDAVVDRCTFKNMKDDPTCNYSWWDTKGIRKPEEAQFMRKGEVGDWKNYLSKEMSDEIEEIYSPLGKQGLHFKYELK